MEKKGVSTVIATLLMLLISIALAGVAYSYFSSLVVTGTQGIELVDNYCNGTHAFIVIKNIGTNPIPENEIYCTQIAPSGDSCTISTPPINPGEIYTIIDACSGQGSRSCRYRVGAKTGGKYIEVNIYCY
ncbi:MAG: archaellin/type IV pilin N-terminal domain-containing protein [Candidatus Aenigmatarchaeota archaeon]